MNQVKLSLDRYGIRTRVLLLFALLVVMPFGILIISVFTVFEKYASQSYGENMADTLTAVAAQVSGDIKKYEEATMSLYHTGCVDMLADSPNEQQKTFIQSTLDACCFPYRGVLAAYIEYEDEIYHGGALQFRDFFKVVDSYKDEITEAKGAYRWYASSELFGSSNENDFILARSLNSVDMEQVGILYLVVNNKMISDAFDKLSMKDSHKYLMDGNSAVLYATGVSLQDNIDMSGIIGEKKGYRIQNNEVVAFYHLWDTDWYFISTISVKTMMKTIIPLRIMVVIVSFIYLIFLFVMISLLQKYIFNPVHSLKTSMDRFAQGELSVQMKGGAVSELADLSKHFNSMTGRIQQLIQKNKDEVTQKNNFRMQALVAQLKPHFIYNALNTIKWTAVINKQENIQNMTQSLIHILMNAAKVDDENYVIAEEIELIRSYAVIQKARFMNFELEIDVEEAAKQCIIRKFLIQPVVENAILHGLGKGIVRYGLITIKIWIEKEMLRISVLDNGIGFDVHRWRENIKNEADHTNIGITSIEQIISLEYGRNYSMNITSGLEQGTMIEYYLPVIKR